MIPFKVLSIAGFDGSGGAGIQADLKTFAALSCYGMTVLTALPVQNTCGVKSCYPIPLNAVREQMEAIFEDIIPDAIKIGMLFDREIISLVVKFLSRHAAHIPIVLDPVMVSKNNNALLLPQAINALKYELIPLATVITPNLFEAQQLVGLLAVTREDMLEVAMRLFDLLPQAVFLKGGHLSDPLVQHLASDLLYQGADHQYYWFTEERISTRNTHGTGCTLSAALACSLAKKMSMMAACQQAKRYLQGALLAAKNMHIGHGHGPVHHFYQIWPA